MDIQWALVFFLLLVGMGCGTFVASIITTEWLGKVKQIRSISMIISLVILAIGGLTSVLHLTHPERIFGALSHPTSGIFVESTMLGLLGLVIIIYLVALKRKATEGSLKIIGTIGIIPAVLLAFAIGNTYVMASRPAWDTLLLPLYYLASASVMGCVIVSILAARSKGTDAKAVIGLNRATLISLAVQTVLIIAYVIYLSLAPFPDASRSASRLLTGDLTLYFWGGIVLLGILVPSILVIQIIKKKDELKIYFTRFGVSLFSILVGGVAFRMIMFTLGTGIKQYF
ncbi:DmsC/YnfH family molybdoenzyme membrane anchor subunit [Robertmurraya massiliosenegalensis]|uniref:DmsC/YnfH family molybdoenzyme membrane anchor subunit n=1 Tax=Robertmurraya TaxID=2837507 RepID=UPI0039A69BA3